MARENRMLDYLKLFRLQTGATTAIAPVIGYLVIASQTHYSICLLEILLIFIIGILMHIFEFVLNEYIDVDVDRRAPDLADKPLVKGAISTSAALGVVIISVVLPFILTLLFFFSLWSVILLILAFEFGAIYDIYGKKFAGSDFALALWIFFFCLFGASIVSTNFSNILYLVAALGFFQILFNNAIEGGLKDIDHDAVAGAKTLANALGAKVRNKKTIISNTFKIASYTIKLGHISIIILLVYFGVMAFSTVYDYLQFILVIALLFIMLYTLQKFLTEKIFRRSRLKRIFSIHEIATYFIAPILLLQLLGGMTVLSLLLIPLIWYIGLNLVLYGRPLEPRV